MELRAGTSGFSYKSWKGSFYPEQLRENRFLEHYAGRLPAVEINNSFYRVPSRETIQGWCSQVGPEFRFAVKASRRITHLSRLKDVGEALEFLIERLSEFGERLGPVLFQLPPNFRADLERLAVFVELLAGRIPAAIEFRHPSWFDAGAIDVLRGAGVALCIGDPDSEAIRAPRLATASFVYARLRNEAYTSSEIADWVRQLEELGVPEAYVFFKHETLGPSYALKMLGRGDAAD